ncbi:MAG: hypothetical protein WAX77_10315 [Methylococcaceae bacterium]
MKNNQLFICVTSIIILAISPTVFAAGGGYTPPPPPPEYTCNNSNNCIKYTCTSNTATNCDSGSYGHYYHQRTGATTWDAAKADCKSLSKNNTSYPNAHLVTISSNAEKFFLTQGLNNALPSSYNEKSNLTGTKWVLTKNNWIDGRLLASTSNSSTSYQIQPTNHNDIDVILTTVGTVPATAVTTAKIKGSDIILTDYAIWKNNKTWDALTLTSTKVITVTNKTNIYNYICEVEKTFN